VHDSWILGVLFRRFIVFWTSQNSLETIITGQLTDKKWLIPSAILLAELFVSCPSAGPNPSERTHLNWLSLVDAYTVAQRLMHDKICKCISPYFLPWNIAACKYRGGRSLIRIDSRDRIETRHISVHLNIKSWKKSSLLTSLIWTSSNSKPNIFVNVPYFDGLTHRIREACGLPWLSPSSVLAIICCVCGVEVCARTALSGIYYVDPSWWQSNFLPAIATDITGHCLFLQCHTDHSPSVLKELAIGIACSFTRLSNLHKLDSYISILSSFLLYTYWILKYDIELLWLGWIKSQYVA
jgi:hypothetical protein